jgi:5-methyltetrahydrofolate--homocysteine methyltransferase
METMETREDILSRIIESVVDGDRESAKELAQAALDAGVPPMVTATEGFTRAMQIVGERYDEKEFFVPEVLVAAKAMEAGVEVLRPHLEGEEDERKGKVTICTIQGDIHDLGKGIVALMLRMHGYDVNDLGRDVSIRDVIDGAKKHGADVIALSALMTTSMQNMKRLVDALEEEGLRDRFKVAVGGAPLSQSYCEAIGADIYAVDAVEAVRAIDTVLSGEQEVGNRK